MEVIRFIYRDAQGETSERAVHQWREVGRYIEGICLTRKVLRTFRKDRIIQYFDQADTLLADPFPPPPPKPRQKTQILFTGFKSDKRKTLEQLAKGRGMDVRSTVTQNLIYLCCGSNAGPTKVRKAQEQNVFIIDEKQFLILLDTGELPDYLFTEISTDKSS